jgi:4-hydroxybenzoate polyprenyltransferase
MSTLRCFVAFCFISSAVYVINDIIDADKDRGHPIKNKRPIASGKVDIKKAIIFAVILFALGQALAITGNGNYAVVLFAALYAILNIMYSLFLQHYAIIDCFCLAAGFLLRIYAGGAAGGSSVSGWLFLTMTAASLFMAFGKRRGEMMRLSDGKATRKVLANYDLPFLNGMIFVCAGLTVVFYALWSIANVSTMIYTVPFVIFIISKYLLVIYGDTSHGDPTSVILGDKGLLAAIGLFGVFSLILLYV